MIFKKKDSMLNQLILLNFLVIWNSWLPFHCLMYVWLGMMQTRVKKCMSTWPERRYYIFTGQTENTKKENGKRREIIIIIYIRLYLFWFIAKLQKKLLWATCHITYYNLFKRNERKKKNEREKKNNKRNGMHKQKRKPIILKNIKKAVRHWMNEHIGECELLAASNKNKRRNFF